MTRDEIVASLAALSSATLHEAMDKRNALWPSIRPLWTPLCVCGPAFTVRCRPGDNLAAHWALAVAPAGSVLVVSHEGDNSCGGWGEIASLAAQARGLAGFVTDGAARDSEACRRVGLPVFSQGVSIRGTTKVYQGEIAVPIVCAGALIRPGDFIVGDVDGVVVVPAGEAETVIAAARKREQDEAEIMRRLRGGELTIDLLGLRSKLPKV